MSAVRPVDPAVGPNHVGATLFWQIQRPTVGARFRQHGVWYEITGVSNDRGGGYLVDVKILPGVDS